MSSKTGIRVVVVGAGLGGLSAAISLAADGCDVTMLEKNERVGGKLNVLQERGFSFDLGPSILTLPHYFEQLFDRHGRRMADYIETRAVTPHWRNFFEDGTRIDLFPDPSETVSQNADLTGEDESDLKRFLEHSRHLFDRAVPSYFDRGLDTVWQMIRFNGVLSTLRRFDLFSSMDDVVVRHIRNKHLRQIFDYFVKYVGSSPYDAPGVLNLLPHAQFAYGLWYVQGGMYELARALERLAKEAGVQIHLGSEVACLRQVGRRIAEAETADGRRFSGDFFVCNMEVIPAYKRLLHEPPAFLEKLRKFEPACSGLVLHLGTDQVYPQLAHHNFFYSSNPERHFRQVFHEHVLPEDPTIYLVAPTRTDPTQAPAGCDNIKILPHIPYVQNPGFTKDDYALLRERVLDKLERMGLKDLRKHIIVEDMWTPEDIERRYYSNCGAIYGVVADRKKNLGLKAPKKSRKYVNLYFVGGSVNPGGGMPMAVLSGQQVRDRIIRQAGISS